MSGASGGLSKAQKIKRRTLVGGGLSLCLAGLLAISYLSLGTWIVFCFGVFVSVLAAVELSGMGSIASSRLRVTTITSCVGVAVTGGAFFASGDGTLPLEIPLALLAFAAVAVVLAELSSGGLLAWLRLENPRRLARIAGTAAWIATPLPALALIRFEFGAPGLVALIVLSKIGDIAGYYVGSAIGKSHPFPNISPGKTTAGCVASLLVGTVCGGLFVATGLLPGGALGWTGGLIAGAVVNLAAQAGDLLESKVKRAAGVKDSGTCFGPSGGVLDLVDSLLLSVPAACLSWPLLFPTA